MSKNIWHTTDEAPKPYEDIAFYVDGYLYFASYEPQYNQYGIFGADKVEKWCYSKELSSYILALETENKDLSDKIGKLETEFERTRKALEMTDTALLTIATNLDKVFPDTRLIFETIRIARKRIAEITALTKGGDNE